MTKKEYEDCASIVTANLRGLRLDYGYTQECIAGLMNMNRSTYSYWETGKTQPSLHSLKLFSQLYDISIDQLYEPIPFPDLSRRKPPRKWTGSPAVTDLLKPEERTLLVYSRILGIEYAIALLQKAFMKLE